MERRREIEKVLSKGIGKGIEKENCLVEELEKGLESLLVKPLD
jgi:hypothetical protein